MTSGMQQFEKRVDERFTAVAEDMADMREEMAEMRGDIAEMRGDIAEMRGDIADLRIDVNTLKDDMTVVKEKVQRIDDIYNLLDASLKRQDTNRMENAAVHHKLDRHEGWIHHLAREAQVVLPA